MPRLSFWCSSAVAAAGVTYVGYNTVYEPQRKAQEAEEERFAASKSRFQDVIHAYARLSSKLEGQRAKSSSCATRTASGNGDTSAWFTNREKIAFFCDIQQMRSLLRSVPHHLTTESDLLRMLDQLTLWEGQHCTELHFRVLPLTLQQTLRSLTCFVVYLVCFRVVDPLLRLWDGWTQLRVRLLHRSSACIVDTLEVKTCMTIESGFQGSLSVDLEEQDYQRDGAATPNGKFDSQSRYLTLCTTHWIEEVGFWACANNPLLTSPPVKTKSIAPVAKEESAPLLQLRGSPCPYLNTNGNDAAANGHPSATLQEVLAWAREALLWGRPSPYGTAFPVTYAQHWHHVATEERAKEKKEQLASSTAHDHIDAASISLSTPSQHSDAAEVSLGYPTLSSVEALRRTQASHATDTRQVRQHQLFIPVGVSGLSRVMYVDVAHAKSDNRPRRTREETYAARQRAQFAAVPYDNAEVQPPSPMSATAGTRAVSQQSSELEQWRLHNGFPWWRRVWWQGVYGAAAHSSDSPTLYYHVGRVCTADEYTMEAIAASRAAATQSSPSSAAAV